MLTVIPTEVEESQFRFLVPTLIGNAQDGK